MRLVLALAAAVAAVAALAGPAGNVAFACSCDSVVPPRDLPRFDAAFVGTPLSHRTDQASVLWTFDVERAVKGGLRDPLLVRAPIGGSACGLEVEEGERIGLLVRADGIGAVLRNDPKTYESAFCYQANADELARFTLPNARVLGSSGGS